MNHCPYCGIKIESEAVACPKCGKDLTAMEKSTTSLLPAYLHPFAIISYLVVLSFLIAAFQIWQKTGKVNSQVAGLQLDETGHVNLDGLNSSDIKYLDILEYQQTAKSIIDYIDQAESKLGNPEAGIMPSKMLEVQNGFVEFSRQMDGKMAPSGLKNCNRSLKTSLLDAKSAVSRLWEYEVKPDENKKKLYEKGMEDARGQRGICENLISQSLKELEPKLSRKKSDFEQAVLAEINLDKSSKHSRRVAGQLKYPERSLTPEIQKKP